MNILIIGGFGYLGGRLAQHLFECKHNIFLGTRTDRNAPDWLPQATVLPIKSTDKNELKAICKNIDIIIHAAGMNSSDCQNDPAAALEFNGVYTAKLLQAAIDQKVTRFIYLSTAHVYRSPLIGIITEEVCPSNVHPYATSHRAGEDAVFNAHQRHLIEGIVIRLSNAFGAPTDVSCNCWSLVVNDLCRQAIMTGEMLLNSSGMQCRDFIPISDVCFAIEYMCSVSKKKLDDGLFNLGGEWSPTVWDMACLIQKRCEIVLDYLPKLSRINLNNSEKIDALDYRIDRISKIGFKLEAGRIAEIDRLLIFCRDAFK